MHREAFSRPGWSVPGKRPATQGSPTLSPTHRAAFFKKNMVLAGHWLPPNRPHFYREARNPIYPQPTAGAFERRTRRTASHSFRKP